MTDWCVAPLKNAAIGKTITTSAKLLVRLQVAFNGGDGSLYQRVLDVRILSCMICIAVHTCVPPYYLWQRATRPRHSCQSMATLFAL